MNFNLIVSPLNEEPVQYELNAKRIGIGRGADNQIVLDYDTVSSSHCEIRLDGELGWVVEDVGSKNGTRINGRAVLEPRQLVDGDRILIGETIPCHFIALGEGEDYREAVSEGGDHEIVSKYVKLNDRLQELEKDIVSKTLEAETLEGHLARLRGEFDGKKAEYEKLYTSIQELQKEIASSGDQDKIDELHRDLMDKTQRITLLKSDIAGTEAQIGDLENTKNATLRPAASAPPLTVAPRVAPPVIAPVTPKLAAPKVAALKPSGTSTVPFTRGPSKPEDL